jgi:tRNA modification GTPase
LIQDTIVAVSTPPGNAALAIIRISGTQTFKLISKIAYYNAVVPKYSRLYKARIHDNGVTLDDSMICLFRGRKSFTGEDMAEIYCHGSEYIVSRILELILRSCRLAKNGEFTFRAFLKGKLDLTQAEAVGNLINATTEKSHSMALLQMEGALYKKIKSLLDRLTEMRVVLELAIDFVEDEVPEYQPVMIQNLVKQVIAELRQLIKTAPQGIITTHGIKICIVGAPNVGKSSLFNAMLETDRAIVTDIPGTTRDYLEAHLGISGYLVRLYDTAGIHSTDDPVEKAGIQKTRKLISEANIILQVVSPENPHIESEAVKSDKQVIKVINKSDLMPSDDIARWRESGYIPCSTLTESGIIELKTELENYCKNIDVDASAGIVTSARQLSCIKRCLASLTKAKEAIKNDIGVDFIAFDVAEASGALEEIIGKVSTDDVLEKIFASFCIGK